MEWKQVFNVEDLEDIKRGRGLIFISRPSSRWLFPENFLAFAHLAPVYAPAWTLCTCQHGKAKLNDREVTFQSHCHHCDNYLTTVEKRRNQGFSDFRGSKSVGT
jgi:hypothetical protein